MQLVGRMVFMMGRGSANFLSIQVSPPGLQLYFTGQGAASCSNIIFPLIYVAQIDKI